MTALAELVRPSQSAIIVVDVQNDFCEPAGAAAQGGSDTSAAMAMIPTLQKLLAAARMHGTNVIFVQTIHEPNTDSEVWLSRKKDPTKKNCLKGTWGAEFTVVAPAANEPVVIKHRYSAFIGTRLDSILKTLNVSNLIMTGVATNVCVESTSRHGYMLDYNVVFASDCAAAYDQEAHDMTLLVHGKYFGAVASADEIIAAWTSTHSLVATV
jgi:ureidoacrylate peracid hydrolase